MYIDPILDKLLRDFYANLLWQSEKLSKLETMLDRLLADMETVKQMRGTHVERIEYTFDQLKVETLAGTLNIGISPSGIGSIEDFAISQQTNGQVNTQSPTSDEQINIPTEQSFQAAEAPLPASEADAPTLGMTLYPRVYATTKQFLLADMPAWISVLEQRYSLTLSPEARAAVLSDLERQIDTRLQVYIQQLTAEQMENPAAAQDLFEKMRRDIRIAVERYFENLTARPPGGEAP